MKRLLVLSGLALAAIVSMPALAVPSISATIDLDTVFAGNIPDGAAPWLTATFTSEQGSHSGTLTLISNTYGSDFLQGLNSKKSTIGWTFYLSQTITGIDCTSGTCADNGAAWNAGGFNSGPVPGVFNLAFGWSSGNRFESGDSVVYDLTFASALTGDPFVLNESDWLSAAHVQGIIGGCSGWIVSGTGRAQGGTPCTTTFTEVVPEPAELGMFGLGLLLTGLFVGLRRRYS
ncbi:PEP-CTERM sorting domain-containing protein [Rhodanobacter ginsengisoli]|uniref:PEP-CTERM sorting domain-containing protein n=1 Tax=Rhodanobacter ginsengisoli TaxID=418646 RepID=A0ABW0QNS3_9GAMM